VSFTDAATDDSQEVARASQRHLAMRHSAAPLPAAASHRSMAARLIGQGQAEVKMA